MDDRATLHDTRILSWCLFFRNYVTFTVLGNHRCRLVRKWKQVENTVSGTPRAIMPLCCLISKS